MAMVDAGPDGGTITPPGDEGCGCRAVGGDDSSPAGPLALVALGLLVWRRRRCR